MNRTKTADTAKRVEPRNQQARLLKAKRTGPIRRLTDTRLDFPAPASLRKSYIVASTYRSGSTYLCSMLWQTGVLGAPAEYWNYRSRAGGQPIGTQMKERLNASSPADYLNKLLACRTSKNGVFGVKAHSIDFKEELRQFPKMLDILAPITYIYIQRQDKVAQAVSMVKATQTGAWVARTTAKTADLRYDKDLIAKCLAFVERQDRDWQNWFAANQIAPFVVVYEKLIADPARVVRGIVELLNVQEDERQAVFPPDLEKQGDETNEEWVARFRRESSATSGSPPGSEAAVAAEITAPPHAVAANGPAVSHVFDRYDEIKDTAARPVDAKRLRHRYEAMIGQNRALFHNARVLNIHSGDGRWSFAALDAGAAHVVGVEGERAPIEAARNAFAKLGVSSASYEFISADVLSVLRTFAPGSFDLILCLDFPRVADPHLFFHRLRRLRPKHVILDTGIVAGKVPLASFRIKQRDKTEPSAPVQSAPLRVVPNHELIRMLCDYFDFRWQVIDWHGLGITDWTGIHDYERNRHRTYILQGVS
jgi:trehalose 2-sulfotransferase